MPRVLITGANGFLGRRIVSAFSDSNWSIRTTDLSVAGALDALPDYRIADLCEEAGHGSLLTEVDCVIHAAGMAHRHTLKKETENAFDRINRLASINLFSSACREGVKHFCFISSVSVYGPCHESCVREDQPCHPVGAYAMSKFRAENELLEGSSTQDIKLTILRPVTLYGPNDPGNVARLIRSISKGSFIWIGDGSNRKSLIHCNDAARACRLAAERQGGNRTEIFNLAGTSYSMREIVTEIAAALGRREPRGHIPASIVRIAAATIRNVFGTRGRIGGLASSVQKWLSDDVFDGEKISKSLQFQPQVDLKEGMIDEVRWFQSTRSAAS